MLASALHSGATKSFGTSTLLALLVLVLAALGACQSQPTATPDEGAVEKSPNDDRDYLVITLDNGLRTLLVSDPKTDKAAAALAVLRGSFDEPVERPGLAHFLEHMLFIGTAKYPEIDGYQQFLSTHGGSSNAYTAGDHTNYFFDVQHDYLPEALDRFAQFFISPLFDPAYVEREKNAVNSEYQLQLKDDGWRGFSARKATMNPDHPGSRFNIGSLDTLAGDVQRDLLAWFQANYSADQMNLVVFGRESLAELEALTRERFADVKNHNIGPRTPLPPVMLSKDLPSRLSYQTQKDSRDLSYTWPVPSLDPHYRVKPGNYIANLLGHEGTGSLYDLLSQRGWVESLGASGQSFDDTNAFISIDMQLTEAGYEKIDAITEAVFDAIQALRDDGVDRWRFEEQAALAELAFRFREQGSAQRFASGMAPLLAKYPAGELLTGQALMQRFDADLIRRYLDALTPENLSITLAAKNVPTDEVERWFKVPYKVEPLPVALDDAPTEGLALPVQNPYIAQRLELVADADAQPTLAVNRPGIELWRATDASFGTPRATLLLRLATRDGNATSADRVRAVLYARLVQDELNATLYPAQLAGLGYQVAGNGAGFTLEIAGYNDKQVLLLERLLTTLTTLEIDSARFELMREQLATDWRNFKSERPYTQAWARLSVLLNSQRFAPGTLAAEIERVTVPDLTRWRDEKLAAVGVAGLVHGNVRGARIEEIAAELTARLSLAPIAAAEPAIASIDAPLVETVSVDHDDSATVLYVQGDAANIAEQARMGFAAQLIRSPYFTALRTEQQLGYVVAATNGRQHKTPGVAFIVQSPVASNAKVKAATQTFLADYAKELKAMPTEAFAAARGGYLSQLRDRDKNQYERSQRLWGNLLLDVKSFDHREQIARAVEALDQETMAATVAEFAIALDERFAMVQAPGKFGAR
ncbi:MAG: insulinase family protein [Pseudomonadota bacterium]